MMMMKLVSLLYRLILTSSQGIEEACSLSSSVLLLEGAAGGGLPTRSDTHVDFAIRSLQESTSSLSLFSRLQGGLPNDPRTADSIPFKDEYLHYNWGQRDDERVKSQLPSELLPPPFVRVHEYNKTNIMEMNLVQLAQHVQAICDEHLQAHGAILFRNLPLNGMQFSTFWNDHVSWPKFQRIDPFYDRHKESGTNIDLAPRSVPQQLIGVHNEQTYNPTSPERVLFYALEAAPVGGETILVQNHVLTQNLPDWVIEFLRKDGHVVYDRWVLHDANAYPHDGDKRATSWQHKLGATTVDEAVQALMAYGFERELLTVDSHDNTVRAKNHHPNRFTDLEVHVGQELWLSSVIFEQARRPNGETLPHELYAALELANWQSTTAFQLQGGDLLVLDNYRVAHGRLPYSNSDTQERKLMTCYA